MTEDDDAIPEESLLAYHAGALPPAERQALAARLAGDAAARATLADWDRQDVALQALYAPRGDEPVPARLTRMIEAARAAAPARRWPAIRALAAGIVVFAIGGTAGWLGHGLAAPGAPDPVTDAALAYRTYVVEAVHPVEVPASDATHLTNWISKRLGHQIHAPDFAREGFSLMGGRVLPSATGAAALFMYQDAAGQRIALYVAPSGSDQTAFRFFDKAGTEGFWWIDRDLCYAIAGTLPRDVLRRIATSAYDQLL
ncbi:MAG: anti-sigma factor [Paracoccaceae bacterium]|nr:anti-sigma factor [Paracoccaceae bacterium]